MFFLFYFLGVFGNRLVLILTLPSKSPSEIICFGVFGMFEMFPITTYWGSYTLKGLMVIHVATDNFSSSPFSLTLTKTFASIDIIFPKLFTVSAR